MLFRHPSDITRQPNPAFRSYGAKGFMFAQPGEQLLPWIQCYWMVTADKLTHFHGMNLYADGGCSLNIRFSNSDFPTLHFQNQSSSLTTDSTPDTDLFGIRFRPGGAFQLLGWRADDNTLLLHPADEHLFLHCYESLTKTTGSSVSTFSQRVSLVEQWLSLCAASREAKPGLVTLAIPAFSHFDGSIEEFCLAHGITRRTFERRCTIETGFSPRQLRELQRIALSRYQLTLRPETSLTRLAQDAGFFDQAHFTRQFQKVTGQTPGQYQQRKLSQMYNPDC